MIHWFGNMQIATGFAKIEDFVSHFIQIEELNFHRFQYMHSLNLDIDKMEDEIKSLHMEAEQAMAENKGNNDNWQQHQHAEEAKVYKLTEQDQHLEGQIKRAQGLIERLSRISWSTCHKIGISEKELHQQGIEEDADPALNLLELLGRVETRAVEVLSAAHSASARLILTPCGWARRPRLGWRVCDGGAGQGMAAVVSSDHILATIILRWGCGPPLSHSCTHTGA